MKRLPSHTVYMLLSESGDTYTGYTSRCIKTRLGEHNSPANQGWTRGRRWHLLAVRMFLDRDTALAVERQLKRSRYDKRNWLRRIGRLDVLRARYSIESR